MCTSEAIRPLWKAIEWVSPPPLCPLSAVCTLLQNSTILTTFVFLLRPLTELIRLLPCCKWFFYWNVVSPALFFQPNFVDMHILKTFYAPDGEQRDQMEALQERRCFHDESRPPGSAFRSIYSAIKTMSRPRNHFVCHIQTTRAENVHILY